MKHNTIQGKNLIPIRRPGRLLQVLFDDGGNMVDLSVLRGRYAADMSTGGYDFTGNPEPTQRISAKERLMLSKACELAEYVKDGWNGIHSQGGMIK